MRKVSGMIFIVMMALLLAACGGDDNDAEPRGEGPGEDVDNNAVVEPTVPPETQATQIAQEATSVGLEATVVASPAGGFDVSTGATPAASPIGAMTSPVASPVASGGTMATPAASPVSTGGMMESSASPAASPVTTAIGQTDEATPMASASPVSSTPAAVAVMNPGSDAPPVASPESTAEASVELKGRVELSGAENSAWIMSDEGCVGLGSNSDLAAGRQVIVRDEAGVIVGVTTLEASDETDACAWTFTVDVPESEYYAVSIPMKTELVFSHDQIAENGGEITIVLR